MSIKDLHICKASMTSKSETGSYIYGEDYVCTDLPPEGYSTSSYISWQHFPRSTSTRSRPCDESEESIDNSPSEPTVQTPVKEETVKSSSVEYPITKSISQLNAMHYLEIRHVFEFLNFLLSHLVCNEPEDPVEFLVELLKKCLKYRDSFGEPPLLFTSSHIRSLYNAFDPFGRNHITVEQYYEAMKSLGLENSITPYNKEPTVDADGCVEESYFLFEAERCLMENLKKMLRIPRIWEENRLIWKKKMKAKKGSLPGKEPFTEEKEFPGEGEEIIDSDISYIPTPYFRKCFEQGNVNCQVDQLYLN